MYANLAILPSQLNRGVSGLGSCGCGGSCCSGKDKHSHGMAGGLSHGVQEYVPNSWQEEFAGFSLGGPLFNPQPGRNLVGMGDLLDMTTWGPGTWALIGGGALLLMFGAKKLNRRRRSRAAMRRVRGY
jgi:hypothetical protein